MAIRKTPTSRSVERALEKAFPGYDFSASLVTHPNGSMTARLLIEPHRDGMPPTSLDGEYLPEGQALSLRTDGKRLLFFIARLKSASDPQLTTSGWTITAGPTMLSNWANLQPNIKLPAGHPQIRLSDLAEDYDLTVTQLTPPSTSALLNLTIPTGMGHLTWYRVLP